MGAGLEFNVKAFATNSSTSSPSVNVWRTGPGNVGSPTTLSPARITGGGLFFLTHCYNPGGNGGTYFPHAYGLSKATGSWQVVSGAAFPNDVAFNVLGY